MMEDIIFLFWVVVLLSFFRYLGVLIKAPFSSGFVIHLKLLLNSLLYTINPLKIVYSFWHFLCTIATFFYAKSSLTPQKIDLPFSGFWTVAKGGNTKKHSHSWGVPSQRFAYDFYVKGDNNSTHINKGVFSTDYHCFGKDIISATDGVVVSLVQCLSDHSEVCLGHVYHGVNPRGNYIIIRDDHNHYLMYCHLKKNSVSVRRGDRVVNGQVIAKCGNSGNSTEPHLHFQCMDRKNWLLAVGLPVLWCRIFIKNKFYECKKIRTNNLVKREK